ncbi:peptide-methionine (S)-S-oxide reductase MsrA [Pseudomonas sp. N040]|uniref:peptide-methionine (S)-S-oxide reductase MsrA n=1 Tax=Pseudomonas sp. N040 TaxID=2785325 RepID=UPI0018A31FB6|nr:peptide-methionine (S)-S-oxide reductase MsrA [Pseudomonas sp. N040]MBF7729156.1 peptide-methionine (S)-S-oxide reductase MsrA [Pseudomonas sp. N040]MBW7012796.1 peptide-methionine (S)-S-oxide reductase MsrA [Pseudomonas sp. N040]
MQTIHNRGRLRRPALAILASLALLAGAAATIAQTDQSATPAASAPAPADYAEAVFAGGCFWCTEADFDKLPGVMQTTSGYTGGQLPNPSYEQVSSGSSGHVEAVRVRYDPAEISYAELLEAFWPTIDPVTANAQFCDKGTQYRSVIFYGNPEEQRLAQASRAALEQSGRLPGPVVTEILPAGTFYPAEAYHQDYHQRNPIRYAFYRNGCGRDERLEQLWGKPAK